jgi:hypothetical protein
VWGIDNDPAAMTVFHMTYTGGPPSSANCASMGAAICTDAGTRFHTLLSTERQISAVIVTDLSSDMGGFGTGGTVVDGTRTGGQVPPSTSVVVSKQVARHYRGGHPRSYLPLGVTTDLASGSWDSTFVNNCVAAWNSFQTDVQGDGVGCTITGEISLSYVSGGAIRATPKKDEITSYSGDIKIGNQRRRNQKQ